MKKIFITTILASAMILPALAQGTSTQVTATQSTTTQAQIFTACSQVSIQKRDAALKDARTAYNTAISNALSVRKESEKVAIAMTDATAKKEAVRAAIETYKKSVKAAQNAQAEAKKAAWGAFETDTKSCRELKKENREIKVTEKRAEIEKKKEERKEEREVKKEEVKTFRQNIQNQINALQAMFIKKAPINTGTPTTTNSTSTVSQ